MQLTDQSVNFGIYNSYDEWGLILEDYDISYPEQKKEFVEVPGKFDTYIDATYSLTKYPIFERRTGKFKFKIFNSVIPSKFETWQSLADDIAKKTHGKKMKIILNENKSFFYEGYVSISDKKLRDSSIGNLEIECDLYPYKKSIREFVFRWNARPGYKIPSTLKKMNFGRMPTKVHVEIEGNIEDDVNILVHDKESGTTETYSYNLYRSFNVWGSTYDIELSGYGENDNFNILLRYERGEF